MNYDGMTNDELISALEEAKKSYRSKLAYLESLLGRVRDLERQTNEAAGEYDAIADILEYRGIVKKLQNG